MRPISRLRLVGLRGGYAGPLVLGTKSGPPGPLAISGTPANAVVGAAYTFSPGVVGGSGTKTYALTGTLPAGLDFSTTTGAITGTPTASGTFSGLTVTVTDTTGSASLPGLSIVVSVGPVALSITGAPSTATVGTAYAFTPAVTGGSGTKTFALAGTLPDGLVFSTTTGAITGTPTTAGTNSGLAIAVSDSSGSATLSGLSITVSSVAVASAILREDGFYSLREDNSRILREAA